MKIRITIAVIIFLFASFVYVLNTYFYVEETIALYLLPYVVLAPLIGLYSALKLLLRQKESFGSFFFKLAVASAICHFLLLLSALFIAYPRYIQKADAIADLDYMVKTMEEVHPNLYDYAPKEDFSRDVEVLKRSMEEKVSVREFFKDLSLLTTKLHDGHTGPDLENLATTGIVFEKGFFPYKIKVIEEKMFVTANYSNGQSIPIGSEILTVNNVPAKEVIEQVGKFIRYENTAYRDYSLSLPIYFNMWNNYRDFTIVYRDTLRISHTVSAGGGLYAKVQFNKEMMKGQIEPYYEFSMLPGNIGYIGFYAFHEPGRFRSFLQYAFRQMKEKEVKNLIIDIRENSGGNSALGDELLQYISPRPFRQYERTLVKISRQVQADKRQEWMKDHTAGAVVEAGDTAMIPLRENPLRFNGKCFLLVGGKTFSAAPDFASAFRCFGCGTIVGSETGGLTVCYGDLYDFYLPASKIKMGVSYKKFYNACGTDDRRGVIPDRIVENTFEDYRNNTDKVLQYTIGLISFSE